MQICNLFLYHENAGVLWICVKVLNRTVFTVIIYVNCHLWGYLETSRCNYVVQYLTEVLTDDPIYTY